MEVTDTVVSVINIYITVRPYSQIGNIDPKDKKIKSELCNCRHDCLTSRVAKDFRTICEVDQKEDRMGNGANVAVIY